MKLSEIAGVAECVFECECECVAVFMDIIHWAPMKLGPLLDEILATPLFTIKVFRRKSRKTKNARRKNAGRKNEETKNHRDNASSR